MTTGERFSPADYSPEARAYRNVPRNPRPLCRDFTAKPAPSTFWCATCGWNESMHGDECTRTAIANELARVTTQKYDAAKAAGAVAA